MQDGKVVFPLGVSAQGDVVISLYHMRSTIGGRLQAKVPGPAGYQLGSLTAVEALGAYCVFSGLHNVQSYDNSQLMSEIECNVNNKPPLFSGVQHPDIPDAVPHRLHSTRQHHVEVQQVITISISHDI